MAEVAEVKKPWTRKRFLWINRVRLLIWATPFYTVKLEEKSITSGEYYRTGGQG